MKSRLLSSALILAALTACGGPAAVTPTAAPTTASNQAAATPPSTIPTPAVVMETATAASVSATAPIALQLDLMRGHLLIAADLLTAGASDDVIMHTYHPRAEHYPKIAEQVKAGAPDLAADLDKAFEQLEKTATAKGDAATYNQQRAAVEAVMDKIEAKLVPDSQAQTPQLIVTVLNTAAAEYSEGVEGGKLTQKVEYQDAAGFVRRAKQRLDAAQPKLDPTVAAQLTAVLAPFMAATSNPTPAAEGLTDSSILETAVATIKTFGLIGAGEGVDLHAGLETLADEDVAKIVAAGKAGNKDAAKEAFEEFEETWQAIEDGVRAASPESYKAIEAAMGELEDVAVRADTLDATAIEAKGKALTAELEKFLSTMMAPATGTATGLDANLIRTTLGGLIAVPIQAIVSAGTAGNKDAAKQGFDAFEAGWSQIEDQIKAASPESYKAIEDAMGELEDAAVRADKPDPATVQAKGTALEKAIQDYLATLK